MVNSVVASLALFGASVTALSCGSAHVVNKCSYDVYLCNVPASGGGYEQADKTLASGESWTQDWTQLSNGNGWSIKLSKTQALENILQYEYTFHNDGIIWYDLSCVNGNPWDANWEITSSTDNCNPKQQAYRYATDDAYGMQSCPQDASITVTLCSGEAADNSTSGTQPDSYSSPAASPVAYSSPAPVAYSSPAPSPDSYSTPEVVQWSNVAPVSTSAAAVPAYSAPVAYSYDWNEQDKSNSLAAAAATAGDSTPTTLATAVVTQAPNGEAVTQVETVYVTNIVTAYGRRAKRHQHHPHGHHNH